MADSWVNSGIKKLFQSEKDRKLQDKRAAAAGMPKLLVGSYTASEVDSFIENKKRLEKASDTKTQTKKIQKIVDSKTKKK